MPFGIFNEDACGYFLKMMRRGEHARFIAHKDTEVPVKDVEVRPALWLLRLYASAGELTTDSH